MPREHASDLPVALRHALATRPAGALCVAFSGGPDSTALLHALAQLPEARARGLRALHIDHGLHPRSADWSTHCRQFCAGIALHCDVLRVQVAINGEGLEAAARHARYAAFAASLRAGETLLLAHHRNDQAETVLLKLLRGAGPEGLGGMRQQRALGAGMLWRPLLHTVDRAQLLAYVAAHALPCIADPSNVDTRLARNQLRHAVLPQLKMHWPQAVDAILHSAALSRAAADALRTQWLAAFATLHDAATGSLHAADWAALDPALREPLLDHWLHARGLSAPTTAQRAQIERQCVARAGTVPCIRWGRTELHIWKGRLWARALPPPVDPHWQASWQGEPLALPDGGTLALHDTAARLSAPLTVRLRRGGEHLKPAGHAHTRELRDLFQQGQLPPWLRPACPLLYEGEALVAVADRWLSARGHEIFHATGSLPHWQNP